MTFRPVPGQIFSYGDDPGRYLTAFISGHQHDRAVVLVPGQTDAPFALHYCSVLAEHLALAGWALVQPTLGSSRPGSGEDHVADSDDLGKLCGVLTDDFGITEACLLSYSTGLQVVAHYMDHGANRGLVSRVIIHGCLLPAGDPMWAPAAEDGRAALCGELVAAGRGAEFLRESVYDVPVTAARAARAGASPLSVQEALWMPGVMGQRSRLADSLRPFKCPLLVNLSYNTAYAIDDDQRSAFEVGVRAAAATDQVTVAFHDDCDEVRRLLRGREAQHAAEMVHFLKEQDRLRQAASPGDDLTRGPHGRSILPSTRPQLL